MSASGARLLPLYAWFLIGAGAALAGLLPWLVTGARLPLQNLAADQSTTATPLALLPFSQYFLTSIVALIVVGVLTVQLVAALQSSIVTVNSLEESTRTLVYAEAVVAVIVVSLATGVLVLLLIARAPVPGATIALSLAAIVSASWIGVALREFTLLGPNDLVQVILVVLQWMPPVLVGCAIAWCGFRTAGRIAAVVVSLAVLWIGPAFFTAVSAAAGTRVLAAYPAEMAEYGIQVFLMALTMPALVIPPLVVALIVGIAGAVLLRALRRDQDAVPDADAGDEAGERDAVPSR